MSLEDCGVRRIMGITQEAIRSTPTRPKKCCRG